jgi:hypothetical protein
MYAKNRIDRRIVQNTRNVPLSLGENPNDNRPDIY